MNQFVSTAGIRLAALFCASLVALMPLSASAGPTDGQKCEASKLKEAGKYSSCRLKAESKGVKKGEAPDYTKCVEKFGDKWGKIEDKAQLDPMFNACPSEGDEVSMEARVTLDAAEIATLLAGGTVNLCGNGVIDAGEECDFGDLNGEDCTSQLGEEALGALACASDTCLFDTSGCQARYEPQNVNGDPTVVDHLTNLEWVVTNDLDGNPDAGDLLDADNSYTWTVGTIEPDGSAFTVYLAGLNGGFYGGHTDWRLPTSAQDGRHSGELESINDCSFQIESGDPCIDESLFGPTFGSNPSFYWTSSTRWEGGLGGVQAYIGRFDVAPGGAIYGSKFNSQSVRAVRGGP